MGWGVQFIRKNRENPPVGGGDKRMPRKCLALKASDCKLTKGQRMHKHVDLWLLCQVSCHQQSPLVVFLQLRIFLKPYVTLTLVYLA